MCVWPSFFPICFCHVFFFSLFPFTAFPTELHPGWLILILTLLINWLFLEVISICPSAGETASSQHSWLILPRLSAGSRLFRWWYYLGLMTRLERFSAKWFRVMGSFQGELATGPFTHSFASHVHTFSVATYPKLMHTGKVGVQKKKKLSYVCLKKVSDNVS